MQKEQLQQISEKRLEKLKKIKNFIPLKTYYQLVEKLNSESLALAAAAEKEQKEWKRENTPQILPKAFFEQKFLKPKRILCTK